MRTLLHMHYVVCSKSFSRKASAACAQPYGAMVVPAGTMAVPRALCSISFGCYAALRCYGSADGHCGSAQGATLRLGTTRPYGAMVVGCRCRRCIYFTARARARARVPVPVAAYWRACFKYLLLIVVKGRKEGKEIGGRKKKKEAQGDGEGT